MSGHLLYLVGQPGSGKTSLARALAGNDYKVEPRPFAHTVYPSGVVELGCPRDGGFGGTDALSMSVQPRVLAWLADERPALVLGEGDRLANSRFLHGVLDLGYTLTVAQLAVSSAVADWRRQSRAAGLETKPQNEAWLRGRITKVRRLAAQWEDHLLVLNAEQRVGTLVDDLVAAGDPVAVALAGEG